MLRAGALSGFPLRLARIERVASVASSALATQKTQTGHLVAGMALSARRRARVVVAPDSDADHLHLTPLQRLERIKTRALAASPTAGSFLDRIALLP